MTVPRLAALASTGLRAARKTCGVALVFAACAGVAWARPHPPDGVPEIDPGSVVSALALLAAGVFMATDRWCRK